MVHITPLQFVKNMCLKQDLKEVLNGAPISVWRADDSTIVNIVIPSGQQGPVVQYVDVDCKPTMEVEEIPLSELDRDQVDRIVEIIVSKCDDTGDEYISWLAK